MKPFPDRLNDRLESLNIARRGQLQAGRLQAPISRSNNDPDVEELAMLANHLQITPQLQADLNFAQRLETQILAHHAVLSRRQAIAPHRNGFLWRSRRTPFALGIALVCLLLLST